MALMTDPPPPRHDAQSRCFVIDLDGGPCRLDYRLEGSTMAIVHTEVPPALEGRGLASKLTQAAVEHARVSGWRVRPVCSYARSWLRRHPEHAALLAT